MKKWHLVSLLGLLSVGPVLAIPIARAYKILPFFFVPLPFIWIGVLVVYQKEIGLKKTDWWIYLFGLFELAMLIFAWMVLGITVWASGVRF